MPLILKTKIKKMKKITLLVAIAVGFAFTVSAQKNASQISEISKVNHQVSFVNSDAKTVSDTIFPTSIENGCDSIRLFITSGGGFVTGNNEYGDVEKGTLVRHTGTGSVTTVFAYLYRVGTVGTSTIKANVYSKGTDNLPGALLASSADVPLSAMQIETPEFVPFTFSTPVAITGDFFVTIVLPTTTGDTIAVLSTSQYCTPLNDTLSIEKWDDGTFSYIKTAYGGSLNIDLVIATVVETSSAVANNSIENIHVYASNNQIVVENNQNEIVKQVIVYNALGQEVSKFNVNSSETVRFSTDFASSNYIVKVITDKKVGSYKLFVR